MDTDSLSFHYKEHFPSYDSSNFININNDDSSESTQETFSSIRDKSIWDWEDERELNGDLALIPMSSGVGMSYLSNSPPAKENFHKIMSDWQHFINVEIPNIDEFTRDVDADEDNITFISDTAFDILSPTLDKTTPVFQINKSSGKKIDLVGQRYILEDDESDTSESSADEVTFEPEEVKDVTSSKETEDEDDFIDVDSISNQDVPVLQAGDLDSLLEQFEATETSNLAGAGTKTTTNQVVCDVKPLEVNLAVSKPEPSKSCESTPDKSKQILEALPEELIKRIKASSKRKVVHVIDPIPAKRRTIKKEKVCNEVTQVAQDKPKVEKVTGGSKVVQLDHDYCCITTRYPKNPLKDSGFESGEDDEQRNILKNQPTFKGANGKLMVSLLKANTIRNFAPAAMEADKQKRKLNLEQYKKRRGFPGSCENSQSSSPINSGRNSPSKVEDVNIRLLKHQEKLMQMAAEVLKTPPKSARKTSTTNPIATSPETEPPSLQTIPQRVPPKNIEVKVIVSIGVNTDVTGVPVRPPKLRVTELDEIKPLLKNSNTKISNNSLITSVIENIQNIKIVQNKPISNAAAKSIEEPHGEDKTILYLDKTRPAVQTRSVETQTEEVASIKRRRRTSSSSSSSDGSCSSYGKGEKRRSCSSESLCSYTSQSCSSSVSSRSRSRSPSHKGVYRRKRSMNVKREQLREVEERRIVYVGGISSTATKEMLRRRFEQFGPINKISVHYREYGMNSRDNYGFVTFAYKVDAYHAVEHGNDNPMLPRYDLSFGGRRVFCRNRYADLDNVQDELLNYPSTQIDNSFDNLLREAQAKLRKRKA